MTVFSPYYLDQNYGGDLNNVPNITQNENGYWQGVSGEKYDINPETGQSGNFIWLSGTTPGWVDVTPDKFVSTENGKSIEMTRNRHGLYSPSEYFYDTSNGLTDRHIFAENPNTGEKGRWVWLSSMGWVNMEPTPQPEPADGTPTFGAGGQIVGEYLSSRDNPDGTNFTESSSAESDNEASPDLETEQDSTDLETEESTELSAGGSQGGSMGGGGGYSGGGIQGLGYSAPALSQLSSSPKIDYVKLLNGMLAVDVASGMMTGRGK